MGALSTDETPVSSAEEAGVVVATRHGNIRITRHLLNLWHVYGWPEDHVLADMIASDNYAP